MDDPYRTTPKSDAVLISRCEYANLLRCAEVLHAFEEYNAFITRDCGRRPWTVILDSYALEEVCVEGKGNTLREATEDALGLPPVKHWAPTPPQRTFPYHTLGHWAVGIMVTAWMAYILW